MAQAKHDNDNDYGHDNGDDDGDMMIVIMMMMIMVVILWNTVYCFNCYVAHVMSIIYFSDSQVTRTLCGQGYNIDIFYTCAFIARSWKLF